MTLVDRNIKGYTTIATPSEIKKMLPLTKNAELTVENGRKSIENILDGKDSRMMIVLGPCSIHNVAEAYDFALMLQPLAENVQDKFLLILRECFEKPRSELGWDGIIDDPNLNGQPEPRKGLLMSRKLTLDVAERRILTATEFLNPQTPQYIDDGICLGWIGARSVQFPGLRKMASGLSMPVGIKNGIEGASDTLTSALRVARSPNIFRGINTYGLPCLVETKGNQYTFAILRGGKQPNYDEKSISEVQRQLRTAGLSEKVLVDCNHGNSGKDYRKQPEIFMQLYNQRIKGNNDIIGAVWEVNITEGSQKIGRPQELEYGKSITDGCSSLKTVEDILVREYCRPLRKWNVPSQCAATY